MPLARRPPSACASASRPTPTVIPLEMPGSYGSPSGSAADYHVAPCGERKCRSRLRGDRRAWDGVAILLGRTAGCELEVRLADVQALERKVALKERDGEVDVVILVVADTRHNREMLELHRDELRELLPLDSRQVLASLRNGRLPDRSGIVLL